MNTKIVIIVLVILAALGFYGYKNYEAKDEMKESDGGSEWILSASFACADNTHFIAEFGASNEVKIIVDGNAVATLPKVAGDGQRFENSSNVYVFAGEEASVTTKATGKTTTCSQPVDPNNAPVNFGDAGEGGGAKQDVSLIVSESIVGKWKSTSDAKFTREFKDNGTMIDYYDGKAVSTGSFKVFTSALPLKVSFPIETNAVYIQSTMTGSQSDTLNFKLGKLTPEELELIYMDRGGVNVFTRVN